MTKGKDEYGSILILTPAKYLPGLNQIIRHVTDQEMLIKAKDC